VLSATDIGYAVGDTTILNGVSIGVEPGELVALCGPNGAGKSTLLKVVSGELPANSGTVEWNGRSMEQWGSVELARSRAKLSQESQLTFSFRVREVVEMGRFPHDNPSTNAEVVSECMDRVGIIDLADRFYTSLSGGEKQRVHLARVLAQLTGPEEQPRLLLLDEPTSALDLLHQEVALSLAHSVCKERGYAVLVVLHDLNLASAWADRIVLLKGGEVRHRGSPEAVLTQAVLRDIYGVDVVVLPHPTTGRPVVTIDRTLKGI
jgi:iron complex transport system ATP-binding protein